MKSFMPEVRRATRASDRPAPRAPSSSSDPDDDDVSRASRGRGRAPGEDGSAEWTSERVVECRRAWRLAVLRQNAPVHQTGQLMTIAIALAVAFKKPAPLVGLKPEWTRRVPVSGAAAALAAAYVAAIACQVANPHRYEKNYEVACELLSWGGILAGQYTLMMNGPGMLSRLRPLTLMGSIIMMRFEFSKQRLWFALRMVAETCLEAGRHALEGAHGGDFARCLVDKIPIGLVKIAFGLQLLWLLERRDKARFLESYSSSEEEARLAAAAIERRRGDGGGTMSASRLARGTGVAILVAVGVYQMFLFG